MPSPHLLLPACVCFYIIGVALLFWQWLLSNALPSKTSLTPWFDATNTWGLLSARTWKILEFNALMFFSVNSFGFLANSNVLSPVTGQPTRPGNDVIKAYADYSFSYCSLKLTFYYFKNCYNIGKPGNYGVTIITYQLRQSHKLKTAFWKIPGITSKCV